VTEEETDLTITVPLLEPATPDDRVGFFEHDGNNGWSRVAEVVLEEGGTQARGYFERVPANVVVLRDDSEPRVTPEPAPFTEPETGITVSSFAAEYTVSDGLLQVAERISVDFGEEPKHGIFRDLPGRIDYDFENDQLVSVSGGVAVLRDGAPEPFQVIAPDTPDDPVRIRIGDPVVEITGAHMYEIRYAVQGAIRQYPNGAVPYYEIAWDVTGQWPVAVEGVSATFTSPDGAIGYVSCFVGEDATSLQNIGLDADCTITESEDELVVEFQALRPVAPGEGMGLIFGADGETGAPELELVPDDNFFDFGFEEPEPEPEQDPLEELPFDLREVLDELRGTYDRVGFAVSAFDAGFAFDVNVAHAPGFEPGQAWQPPSKEYDSRLAELVPENTMFFLSYFDVYGQYWLPAREQLDDFEFEDGQTLNDLIDEAFEETGIDLEGDVMALLTGEIALAGNVSNLEGDLDFEGFAIAEVNDEAKALSTLENLEDYLESEGELRASEDGGVHVWESLTDYDAEPIGWVVRDGKVFIGYPDSAVEDAREGGSLAETGDWQRTIDLLPDGKTFVGFISVARILEEIEDADLDEGVEESTDGEITLRDLEPVRSIGFSGSAREDGFGFHAVLFMED
jgi:hypothetical protein